MALIGTLTLNSNGEYVGTLKTLTLNVAIKLQPLANKKNEKSPDYRIVTKSGAEVGAAWIKTSNSTGADYVSLSLDTPELPHKINANLGVKADQDDPNVFAIIWNRPN